MPRKINSFQAFHKLVPLIIRKVNKEPELAIRAAANPLLAFEEMGFKLTSEVKKEVEVRIRFSEEEVTVLSELRKEIQSITGKDIDPLSDKSVESFLFKDLKIKKPPSFKALILPEPYMTKVYLGKEKQIYFEDPLTAIKSDHPAVKKLQQYRKLYMSKPGFVSKELYEKLKSGEVRMPVRNIKIRLPENHHLREEVNHA